MLRCVTTEIVPWTGGSNHWRCCQLQMGQTLYQHSQFPNHKRYWFNGRCTEHLPEITLWNGASSCCSGQVKTLYMSHYSLSWGKRSRGCKGSKLRSRSCLRCGHWLKLGSSKGCWKWGELLQCFIGVKNWSNRKNSMVATDVSYFFAGVPATEKSR